MNVKGEMPPADQDPDPYDWPRIWASQVSPETLEKCITYQIDGRTGGIDDLVESKI